MTNVVLQQQQQERYCVSFNKSLCAGGVSCISLDTKGGEKSLSLALAVAALCQDKGEEPCTMLQWGDGISFLLLLGFILYLPLGRFVPVCVFGFICSEGSDFRATGAVWLLLNAHNCPGLYKVQLCGWFAPCWTKRDVFL